MRKTLITRFTGYIQSFSQQFYKISSINKFDRHKKNKLYPTEWTYIYTKGYPRFERISLPIIDYFLNTKNNFYMLLKNRKSRRNYDSSRSISIDKISHLLRFSVGNKEKSERRYYPSAGARYPIETYILSLNSNELLTGAYHYHIKSHSLEFLWKLNKNEILSCFNQSWIKKTSFLIVLSTYFWRNEIKYGNRGYRYSLIEIGHIAQNIYLICEALNIACCSVGGFIDKKLNSLFDFNTEQEVVNLVIACGMKGGEK